MLFLAAIAVAGCTVKAVGDPNRPITINANVVVDIRGLKQTAKERPDVKTRSSNNNNWLLRRQAINNIPGVLGI